MALEEIACLLTLSVISDVGTCVNSLSGGIIWNIVYIGLLAVFVLGWTVLHNIQIGMMIGGFVMTFIGIGLIALEFLSVYSVMVAIIVCLVGIFLTYMMKNQ